MGKYASGQIWKSLETTNRIIERYYISLSKTKSPHYVWHVWGHYSGPFKNRAILAYAKTDICLTDIFCE